MANIIVECKNCKKPFGAKSKKAEFCTTLCRNEYIIRSSGNLNDDYIICELCHRAVASVSGIHMRTYHPEYTPELYRKEFPNSLITPRNVSILKSAGAKKAGARMREPEHRKRLSESYKGEKNPMHKTNVDEEFRKSISPFSPNFYQKRFPNLSLDECKKLAEDKQKSVVKVSQTQIGYWIKKGFSEEEAKNKISELQKTFSLEICIRKYGEEEGRKKWEERQKKWKNKVFNENTHIGGGTSMIGLEFIENLLEIIKDYKFNVMYAKNEKFIKNKDNKVFKYDLTIKDLKIIFEFNGDYWHCNPLIWNSEDINKAKKLSASEIWKYDEDKIKAAVDHGYEIITIWEKDYREDPHKKLHECKKLIDEKVKNAIKKTDS